MDLALNDRSRIQLPIPYVGQPAKSFLGQLLSSFCNFLTSSVLSVSDDRTLGLSERRISLEKGNVNAELAATLPPRHRCHWVVGDLLCPQPAVSSDQAVAQGSGVAADLVSVLHRGALPIPLQEPRSNVTEEVQWQIELSKLSQLANRLERIIEPTRPESIFSCWRGEYSVSVVSPPSVAALSKASSRPNVADGNWPTVSVQKRFSNALDADAKIRSNRSGVGGSIPRSRKR
jgi:hypothetical protein